MQDGSIGQEAPRGHVPPFWPDRAVTVAIQTDKPLGEYGALAALVERLGFDGLSIYDDLGFQPSNMVLPLLVASTSTLRVGVACANPFLVHPFVLASGFAALQTAADGRCYLGLARGSWLRGVGAGSARPLLALREAAEVVRRVLAGNRDGYHGTCFPLAPGVGLQHSGPVPCHLLIGTWGERAFTLAAELGDEVKLGGTANPDITRLKRNLLHPRLGLAVGAVCVVDQDRDAARALARREVAPYLDVVAPFDTTVEVPEAMRKAVRHALQRDDLDSAAAAIPDQVLDRFAFAGTPHDVTRQVLALFDAGASRVELGTPHGLHGPSGLELLGREVLPAVRAALLHR